jgi:hypothetical protein
MSTTSDSLGRRAGRAFTRLVVTLIVLGLLGAVGFLLSQLRPDPALGWSTESWW